jgi:hypothetical protein
MNFATPHTRIDGKVVTTAYDSVDNIGPAGAINSNAEDMARWLQAQLDSGRTPTGRVWSAQRTRELWTPATLVPVATQPAPLAPWQAMFSAYALGLNVRDYRGHRILIHSGGLQGMVSQVIMVPDLRLGVAVLSNAEEPLPLAVALTAIDGYMGGPVTDWIGALQAAARLEKASADSAVARKSAARHAEVGPSLPLSALAGPYSDAMYGDASIALENGKAVLRFSHSPGFTGDLEHWQYDTFVAHWRDKTIPDAFVTFVLKPTGEVDSFCMEPVSPAADFSFDYRDLHFRPVPKPAAVR